jgi:predicted nucleic-acid-binding Zn-ribbon protein
MKSSGQCPRCEGQSFFAIDEVNSPNYNYSNSFEPLGIACLYDRPKGISWVGGKKGTRLTCTLEAWVCKSCAYTEFYAKNLALLERLAAAGDGVRTVESSKT